MVTYHFRCELINNKSLSGLGMTHTCHAWMPGCSLECYGGEVARPVGTYLTTLGFLTVAGLNQEVRSLL
jgi:hypothetical protein